MKHFIKRYTDIDFDLMIELVDCLLDGDWSNQPSVERAFKLVNDYRDNEKDDPQPVDVALAALQVQFNAGMVSH